MVIGGVSNFGLTGYAALLVLFLIDNLRLPPGQLGLVLMVGSAGGLLGALVAPALGRRIGTGRASNVLFWPPGPARCSSGPRPTPAAPTSPRWGYYWSARPSSAAR